MAVKIFVIIATYKGKQWYDKCFSSLRNSEIPVQTIVIDNMSSDNSVNYIQTNFPEVILIELKDNIGFGQANNIGINYALDNGADYVFLLNQDTWIENSTIADLISIYKSFPNFGILSPVHLNSDKTRIEKDLLEYIANYRITSIDFINDLYFGRLKEVYETKYVNAASWLIPRDVIETVGGFDPVFFHYGEDDNYMQRVLYHGYKIGICPGQTIVHDTERRVVISKKAEQNREKRLLVDYTNISMPFNFCSVLLSLLAKLFRKSVSLKWSSAKLCIHDLIFVIENRSKIRFSRNQNCRKGPSWL